MKRLSWLTLAWMACTIVDETGYLCSDGMRVAAVDMCMALTEDDGSPPATPDSAEDVAAGGGVTLSGYAYTSTAAIGAAPSAVFVIGPPGSVPAGSSVSVGAVSAAVRATSFVASVEASLGASLDVRVDGTAAGMLSVETSPPGQMSPLADAEGVSWQVERGGDDLTVTVDVGAAGYEAPTVVFNPELGAVRVVALGTPSVSLPASEGDRLCVAEILEEGLSLALCAVVRVD